MTTPMSEYAKIAAQYGGVDPEDAEAVDEWFGTGLADLPVEKQQEIVEKLIGITQEALG